MDSGGLNGDSGLMALLQQQLVAAEQVIAVNRQLLGAPSSDGPQCFVVGITTGARATIFTMTTTALFDHVGNVPLS